MDVEQRKLRQGVEAGIITRDQADRLEELWRQETDAAETPDAAETAMPMAETETPAGAEAGQPFSRFLYYLGALIVIGSMSWLMNTAWEQFRGGGLVAIAVGYAAAFCALARYFRTRSQLLAGLFVVMAVCMTPLAVFGLQVSLNVWPYKYPGSYPDFYRYIRGGWFPMEAATLVAGVYSLRYSRIPFAMAPVAFTLWFLSMDIAPILGGADFDWTFRKKVSIAFGLLMLAAALWTERRQRVDYAKWLYIFGAVTFWGGLTLLRSDSELSKFLYCLVNVLLMFCGILLERRVFLVFGGIGFFGYLGYLSWSVFRNAIAFPFLLTLLGLAVVGLGWAYHRKYAAVQRFVLRITPPFLLNLLPPKRGGASGT